MRNFDRHTNKDCKTIFTIIIELCKPPESDANSQDDDCTYVPDANLQENHEITPPRKRPKLLSRVASLIEEKKKQSDQSASLSSEEKEVDRYSKDSFNIELEDDPLTFGIQLKSIQLLHLLCVTFYVYHLQQPQLKGYFQPVGNQHLENATD